MNLELSQIDIWVFVFYCLLVIGIGYFAAREKKGHEPTTEEYFLAGKTLPWWAVGAALIAANISAEQFIGMSGSGYAIGIAISSYEWMSALTLVIVGKYFLPIFLKNNIMTMPQFLEKRFDNRVKTSLAIFWIFLYVFINLTSVLYLGALFLETVVGLELMYGILILALFTAIYSIYGGLMSVAWTDVIHVFFLVVGGIITTIIALSHLGEGSLIVGFNELYTTVPEKFDLILSRTHEHWDKLPGISVLIGGMWLGNLSYWGFSQYVTQKAFAAKNLKEAQKGVIFAGYLKLFMPFIVVLPGMIAFSLNPEINPPDKAYPWLLSTFVPVGLKGITIAALFAAIVSSLSSMTNSTATIFTMDIYKQLFKKKEFTERQLVRVGRTTSIIALGVATFIAKPLLGNLDQVFQFIQEYYAYLSPLIVIIFGAGFFWKRATSNAVLWAAIVTLPISIFHKMLWPDMPFMNREVIIFFILLVVIVVISYLERSDKKDNNLIEMEKGMFHTSLSFNVGAIGISLILTALYIIFW